MAIEETLPPKSETPLTDAEWETTRLREALAKLPWAIEFIKMNVPDTELTRAVLADLETIAIARLP